MFLGPLKDLDVLIDEVLALDSAKSYLRKQVTIRRTTTGDLSKSAALATFQKKSEKSCILSIILEIQLQIGIKKCMI
jgi:uncharacterized OsmC-like protein